MYTGLGSYRRSDGLSLNTPLVVDGVAYPDWNRLPADLDTRSVKDSSGRTVQVMRFLGGFLVDGCPLNVAYGDGWIPGQQDALKAAGITPCVPLDVSIAQSGGQPVNRVTTMSPALPANSFVAHSSSSPVGPPIDWGEQQQNAPAQSSGDWQQYLPYAALGLFGLVLLTRRGGR